MLNERRWTIPGLFSHYTMESSAIMMHQSTWPIICERYAHLLAYKPLITSGCEEPDQTLLVGVDMFGAVASVSPVSYPDGTIYQGSMEHLAVSRELGTVWGCGRANDRSPYMLYSFALADLVVNWTDSPARVYVDRPVSMCAAVELDPNLIPPTEGKSKCLLSYDRMTQWLWIGNTAQPGEPGRAAAYEPVKVNCTSGGGSAFMVRPFVRSRMVYGPNVVSFTFTMDILGDEYLTLARCDNFRRNQRPCRLEFHAADRWRRNMYIGARKPTDSLRVPTGIGSLVADTSLGVRATAGGFLSISYIGTTAENIEWTTQTNGNPEDRLFLFRVPILRTGTRKSVDVVSLRLLGIELLPGAAFLPNEELRPNEADTWPQNWQRRLSDKPARVSYLQRRLSKHRRRLAQFDDCFEIDLPFPFPVPPVRISFGLNLVIISISGYFAVIPTLRATIVGRFCMDTKKLTIGLDVQLGFRGIINLSAEFRWLVKGDLLLDASVMQLRLLPTLFLDCKQARASGRLQVGVVPLSVNIAAGIYYPTIKFCRYGGCCCWGLCAYVWMPCGFRWSSRRGFAVARLGFGGHGRLYTLFGNAGEDRDRTPPIPGKVSLTQTGPGNASVTFGGFYERESELKRIILRIRAGGGVGRWLHTQSFEPTSESWDGDLQVQPEPGEVLRACATAVNEHGGRTTRCAPTWIWDGLSPQVETFLLHDAHTGGWRQPPGRCRQIYHTTLRWPESGCDMYTNATTSIKFALRLRERPNGQAIKKAHWGVTRHRPCAGVGACQTPMLAPFAPIGHSKRLASGDYHHPMLEVVASGVNFIHGERCWINLLLCDAVDNCGVWAHPYALVVDQTPPPSPLKTIGDRNRATSADGVREFFVSPFRIDPAWLFVNVSRLPNGRMPELPALTDPESGAVRAQATMYRIFPGTSRTRQLIRQYRHLTTEREMGPQTPAVMHASQRMYGLDLELGGTYILQLTQTNVAGGVTQTISSPIVADWTSPVCATPMLGAGYGQPLIRAGEQPPGGSTFGRTRAHNWVGPNSSSLSLHITADTCRDEESGIYSIEVWAGSRRDGVDDLLTAANVSAPAVHMLDVSAVVAGLNLTNRAECTTCSDSVYIGVRCTNWANQWKNCNRYLSFKVDGSRPVCQPPGWITLGDGARPKFQSSMRALRVGNLDSSVEDEESGIARTEYALEDVTSNATGGNEAASNLTALNHAGAPPPEQLALGLNLLHAHTYRLRMTVANPFGL